MRMPSTAFIPASSSSLLSSASRKRHQFRYKPAEVPDYPPLELPLRWRDPPPFQHPPPPARMNHRAPVACPTLYSTSDELPYPYASRSVSSRNHNRESDSLHQDSAAATPPLTIAPNPSISDTLLDFSPHPISMTSVPLLTQNQFPHSLNFSVGKTQTPEPTELHCSLTQNSIDNFEQLVGGRPLFQDVDQASSGNVQQSQASIEPKRKGEAGALVQNSISVMNGHHNLNSYALLWQQNFPSQSSCPQSVRSHDTLSEHCKAKKMLTRERRFHNLSRSEQQEDVQIVVNTLSVVEKISTGKVSESLQEMEGMLQDMSEHSMNYPKGSKHRPIYALQGTLQRRTNLTVEPRTRDPQTLLEIFVTLRTDLPYFLQRPNNVSASDLVQIHHNLRCHNISCRNSLPVDNCDCKIFSQKNALCSTSMCLVCSKFEMVSNASSWVGCDVCLHSCHTDSGLRCSYGRSSAMAPGTTKLQFDYAHPSEMFGLVFKMCSQDWIIKNIAKNLQYVRRMFCASNDMREPLGNDDQRSSKMELFERMPEFRLSPDDVTYSAMIDAYCHMGNVEMDLALYDQAVQEKWHLGPIIFATVIKVYEASGLMGMLRSRQVFDPGGLIIITSYVEPRRSRALLTQGENDAEHFNLKMFLRISYIVCYKLFLVSRIF